MDKVVSHIFFFWELDVLEEMSGSLYHICTGISLTTKWNISKLNIDNHQMGKSKLQIPKVCKYRGNTFLAKTVKTGYCSHQCAWSASNDRKKMERRQKVLDKIKAAGTEYITITEALKNFTTSRLTVIRLVHSKNNRCFKTSPKRWYVCVKDLEALFPLRSTSIVVETPKASQVFDMNPKNCYTIGKITKRFGIITVR